MHPKKVITEKHKTNPKPGRGENNRKPMVSPKGGYGENARPKPSMLRHRNG